MDDKRFLSVSDPPVWHGDPHWPVMDEIDWIFIRQFAIRSHSDQVSGALPDSDFYLFGGIRVSEFVNPNYVGPQLSRRIEFIVVEQPLGASQTVEHHLAQALTPVWIEPSNRGQPDRQSQSVDMIKKNDFRFLARKPRWSRSGFGAPQWPMLEGRLMLFIGQVYVPENDMTREKLFPSNMILLFVDHRANGELCFAVDTQDTSTQSAEDHYEAEELMARFETNRSNEAIVKECVAAGNKYVQEYILEKKDVTSSELALLAQHGVTKTMRTASEKKLRSRK
jgi:hypothetical protein